MPQVALRSVPLPPHPLVLGRIALVAAVTTLTNEQVGPRGAVAQIPCLLVANDGGSVPLVSQDLRGHAALGFQ